MKDIIKTSRWFSCVLALFIALLAVSNHASAATITVQSNIDDATTDASRCPGTACRLRDAVEAAASGDTINFGSDMTINIPSYSLQIDSKTNLTIDGTGRNVTIYGHKDQCTGWGCWEMIDIIASSVTLNHLTFSNGGDGSHYPDTPVHNGGALAINGQSTLTITNSTFTNNSGKRGGAIASSGNVTIINSNFSNNRAWQGGGAIDNSGTLTITGTAFSNNQYLSPNSSAPIVYGGAICNTGTLNVADSTFTGQSLPVFGWMYDTKGGGIYNTGTAAVTRSTFTGNSATYGGGIYNTGSLRLTNSTFSGNAANGGGGLRNESGTADVLSNTFVANSGERGYGSNIGTGYAGQLSLFVNNIVAYGSIYNGTPTCDFSAAFSYNNLSDTPSICGTGDTGVTQSSMLLLGTIGNYGGSTATIPLLPGSAAINAGNDTYCASVDQRGFTRIQGTHCDIGAFESRGFTLGSATGASQRTEINTEFAEPLGLTVASTAGDPVDGGQVTLTAPASGASIATTPMAATIAGGMISAHVTANGTAGGPYNVTAAINNVPSSVNFSLKNTAVGTNTVTSLSSNNNPALPGQTIVFTATVTNGTGTPTGTVAFKDNGGVITGCSAQTLNGGNAVCSTSSLSIGNHTNITAVYSGSTTFNPGASAPYSQTVKYNSTATVVSSPNPSYGLETVVFTAAITSTTGTPTGTVTFYDNGSAIGSGTLDAGGKATMSISSLLAGAHPVTATYGGDASYLGSTSTATSHTVNQAATTISLSSAPNPSVLGQLVIFTATVTGSGSTPGSGTVAFKNNGVDITGCGARVVNAGGQTTCSTSELGLGTHSNITAVYSGSTNFLGSTSEPYSHMVSTCIPTIVTNNNDSGEGSLRAALEKVCVAFSSDMTITLASTLVIAGNLTIDGAGHSITVSGNNAVRVISNNPGVTLNLNNLTVANGKSTDSFGGGIFNNNGTLNVTNSTFTGNSGNSASKGGGIFNNLGTLNVTNSTFTGNSATNGGGIGDYAGTLNVTNSTFTGNSATNGGGIYKYQGTGTLTNSTLHGSSRGGGFYQYGGTLTVTNCTVTGNSSVSSGSGFFLNSASVTFNNTIVANNTGTVNCNSISSSSSGANNLSNDASCGAAFTQSSSILLGGLGSYDGSTQTIPLLPGSSALDAGNTATCTATDQRGKSRIGTCDIGAFESQGFTLTATGGNNQSSFISTFFANPLQVTLSESGGNPLPGAGISYSAPDSGSSASIAGSPATTDAAGIAVVSVTANDITGSYAVIASATNDANIKASLSLTNISGFTVIYNGNGSTGGTTPTDAGSYLAGATVTVLTNTFTKTGYSFAGWNSAADGSGTFYGAGFTMGSANTVLYAKWTALPTYAVTYNTNGSTSGTAPGTQAKTQGIALTLASNSGTLTKTGYTFAGWNTAADGSGTNYAVGATYSIDAAITLYAKWTALPTYAVTYNTNGSTSGTAPGTQTKTQGVALTLATNSGTITKTGFTFAGWNSAADGSGTNYAVGATYSIDAAITLYAKWTALPTYAVTYNTNGGSGTMTDAGSPYLSGATVTVLANTFTRSGYSFAGWYPAADGSGTVYGASFTMGSANTVLYAKWTALPTCAVTYNTNGSTSGTAPGTQTKTQGVALTLATNSGTITKTGFTFAGWNSAADGSGTSYAVGATYSIDAAITLYAKWMANQTISFAAIAAKTYGAVDFGPGASATSGLAITYTSDTPAVATITAGGLIHIVGAGNAIITANQTGDSSHNPASAQQPLTVNKAALIVTAQAAGRAYAAVNPVFTASYSGFVNNEDATVLSGTPSLTTNAVAISVPGPYPITAVAGTLSSNKYSFSYVNGTLTVNKATPVITWPTATTITYGQTLASSTLTGGSATPSGGAFTWTTSITAPNAGSALQGITYTPADTANYTTATGNASVTVNKANSSVTTWPAATAITYGQTLASSTLSGGTATPAGTFAFTAPSTAPVVGTSSQGVTFTPADTANYNTVTGTASVTVNAAPVIKTTPAITWATPAVISAGIPLSVTQLNATANVSGTFSYTPAAGTVLGAGPQTLSVSFTPNDTTNYNTASASVTVTVIDLAPPTITSITISATSSALTVPVISLSANDNVGVTGYLLSESSSQPQATDAAWSASIPASYIFASQGVKTLYAFAKDAAGNVSAPATASVAITMADTVAPIMDTFAIPATADSLNVAITTLTASDTVGVTSWLLSESASQPQAGDAAWSATKPASRTFASQGAKTLHAFAKDAAGNISAPATASVTISLPDRVAPSVDSFIVPTSLTSLTGQITALTASDNTGVTGYFISESANQPQANDAAWTATVPASYTFASQGAKTLYAFAKDAAGNISAPATAGVTITMGDTTAPTVNSFIVPATLASLTCPITTFTATDNVGVTGYLISEAATASAADSRWTTTRTNSYTFDAAGTKTLYAFAKDAAGNVSAPATALVTVTLSDTVAPTVNVFTVPATLTTLTCPITNLTATDNVAVTGFYLSETATTPDVSASGWTSTPPAAFTFGSAGNKTLYAYTKDAAGNISALASASVTITMPDSSAPTITVFTVPASSENLTVAITTLSASDDTAVTGYLVTEAATASAADSGWNSTVPASFTFGTEGSKTLYAYAKDAAGNISAPATANVTITTSVYIPPPAAVDGVCGSANNSSFVIAPASDLCASGAATVATGSGPWSWSCGGANGGSSASCSANLTTTFSVTPSGGAGSSITPSGVQSVTSGATASFTITANPGFGILGVTGCGGNLSDATYTTAAITGNCGVTVIAVKRNGATIADALRALQAYTGSVQLSPEEMIRYDVAPLVADGIPQGDGVVDFADAILILRRSLGIGSW